LADSDPVTLVLERRSRLAAYVALVGLLSIVAFFA
jgi:hypothetical protein